MVSFEKIVKGTDAVLNCIPLVSTVNNGAQALYKLAHRVDTLNPVAPGLKTTIQIHILSKRPWDHWIESIPLLGNWIAWRKLSTSIRYGFKDDLLEAVLKKNQELVHLNLGNKALNDPNRAKTVLKKAAAHSSPAIFQEILNHRSDWSADSLLETLKDCLADTEDQALNAQHLLDYWDAHGCVLDSENVHKAIYAMASFYRRKREALTARVLAILPNEIPFCHLRDLLFNPSTEEHRIEFIAKSAKPSLEELTDCFHRVGYILTLPHAPGHDRDTHFDTLNRLTELAQLDPDELGAFIARTFLYDEPLFTQSLITKYEKRLSPESKVHILKGSLPSDYHCDHEKRVELFAFWINEWKKGISPEKARRLYQDLCESVRLHIQTQQRRFEGLSSEGEKWAIPLYPSVESLETVYAQLQKILLDTFPGCNQIL